jgi:predicted glycogen debranching enzyme
MQFVYDKINEDNKDDNCFLLTNGLGGYSSLTVSGSCARGDHALLMSAKKAPNVRYNLIANVYEKLIIDEKEYVITSQRMSEGKDYEGYRYLQSFIYDDFCEDGRIAPATWYYEIEGCRLTKSLVMEHGENTVSLRYEIDNTNGRKVSIEIMPVLRCCSKKESFDEGRNLDVYSVDIKANGEYLVAMGGDTLLYGATNASVESFETKLFGEMYYAQDERDGRQQSGNAFVNHKLIYSFVNSDKMTITFSTKQYKYDKNMFEAMAHKEINRKNQLVNKAALNSELGKQLVVSANSYIVDRASTKGKSIIAGYPFFEDWGRDTMISLAGATLVTGRFEECKSILRTFAKYVKGGLLPNLFPEGDENPMYNSVDAPLLFINAVYEYMVYSGDWDFKAEILPVLQEIVASYINGTDYHIKMDSDGLIMAGEGLEQLTWMDVRVGDFLPTPRHGKPVEINAYWYNALMIMEKITDKPEYSRLAEKVKESFNNKFWNEDSQCLKDVLSGKADENQIRCNQIWALTMPFTMLDSDREALVIKKVKEELYTTAGLRTLSMKDKDFHPIYIGEMQERDRAYHQGTVWAFPLGAYYRACMRNDSMREEVVKGISLIKDWLYEGCAAQLAEIYDGERPTVSRGCFAQAWSVCELLRAVAECEKMIE